MSWRVLNESAEIANFLKIQSRLSRCSTDRGSGSGLSLGGPSKVKACECSLKVENKEHLVDFFVTLVLCTYVL